MVTSELSEVSSQPPERFFGWCLSFFLSLPSVSFSPWWQRASSNRERVEKPSPTGEEERTNGEQMLSSFSSLFFHWPLATSVLPTPRVFLARSLSLPPSLTACCCRCHLSPPLRPGVDLSASFSLSFSAACPRCFFVFSVPSPLVLSLSPLFLPGVNVQALARRDRNHTHARCEPARL